MGHPFKLNKTANRIVEFVRTQPGKTKRGIAAGLHLSDSTIEGYIGPLKIHGYIEADHSNPPRYVPACEVKAPVESDGPVYVLARAMYAMVSVGFNRGPLTASLGQCTLPSRIYRQSMDVDNLEAA
ncbi:hypothetical protein AB4Y43_01210 [Paraburkholderia sp. BR10872]|uniref:hypothetical protein n=1 Tax=Paraburkholderia sp. BR10872 TaxID=3236989 RepID=UPI0034D2BFC7